MLRVPILLHVTTGAAVDRGQAREARGVLANLVTPYHTAPVKFLRAPFIAVAVYCPCQLVAFGGGEGDG